MAFFKNPASFKEEIKKPGFQTKALLTLAMLIYFIFGFYHLSDFITADEHFWLPNSGFERISDYWNAIRKGEWAKTRINDKPGITLAYTSGIAMLFDNGKGQIINNGTTKHFDPARTQQINFLYRLPILILSGLFSLFFFWVIKKITEDEWVALWSSILILLSPTLLGISQIVNPDSLFWIFASASLFSFFAYLQKSEKKTAVLAGVFLGLGLASKYVSVIMFPFFFLVMLAFYLFEYNGWQDRPEEWRTRIIKNALVYLAIIAGGMLIFAILMPASFVEPKVFYSGTIGFPGMKVIFWAVMALNVLILADAWLNGAKIFSFILKNISVLKKFLPIIIYALLAGTVVFVVVDYLSREALMKLSGIPFDLKQKDSFGDISLIKRFIVEFRPLVFSLTPLVLFALLFAWIKSIFDKSRHELLIFILSAFFLVFYAAVIIQGLLVTTRYSIILFPFAMVLTAIAIREFFSLEKGPRAQKAVLAFIIILVAILALHVSSLLLQAYPSANLTRLFILYTGKHYYYFSAPLAALIIGLISWLCYRYFPWQQLRRIRKIYLTLAIIIISIINLWLIKPFYFSYTNDLLPKQYIISGAWGYGGYEAAQYLNALPNAQNLTVWADVYGVCEFFAGRCTHSHHLDTTKIHIDYYFRSLQASVPLDFPHAMESKAVWRINIDGRPKSFLKIQKAKPINAPADTNNDNNADDNAAADQ